MRRAVGLVAIVGLLAAGCSDDDSGSATSTPPTDSVEAPEVDEADEPEEPDEPTLPTAPAAERVDRDKPTFSNPTQVINPLFPISELHSAVLLGNNDGHPLRIETTLLAAPKVIDIDGEPVGTLVSQFVWYEDGRIHEVAVDWYAKPTTARSGTWVSLAEITSAWTAHQAGAPMPPLLAVEMDNAIASLTGDPTTPAIADRNVTGAQKAAIDVAMASLDLQLQFRPPAEIDLARLSLWTSQVLVDAGSAEPDASHVAGDVTVLEWTWDRILPGLDDGAVNEIKALLDDLQTSADDEDPAAAVESATALLEVLDALARGRNSFM